MTVYSAADPKKVEDKIVLNKPAASIKGGGGAGSTDFSVTIDWKDQSFEGKNGVRLGSVILKLTFKRGKKEFTMTGIEVSKASVNGENIADNQMKVS